MQSAISSPLERQIGGDHYCHFAIQPSVYCQRNNLNWCEGNVVKYISRHRHKGGREDLEKAKHYIDLLIALDYPEEEVITNE